jgi:hypothetical protein
MVHGVTGQRSAASLWSLAPGERVKWLVALIETQKLELTELRLLRRVTLGALIDEGHTPSQVARDFKISRETLYKELRRLGRELPPT